MKKVLSIFSAIILLVTCFAFVGCGEQKVFVLKEEDTFLVITASSEQMQITANTTLLDYMKSLKQSGSLEFEADGTMITSINGIANPADFSSAWMLYTSDEEHSFSMYGTVDYNGVQYGSTDVGASDLVIKEGEIYIFYFQAF